MINKCSSIQYTHPINLSHHQQKMYQSKSQPKFRQVNASRIKDGRTINQLNQYTPAPKNYQSPQKKSNPYNPQSPAKDKEKYNAYDAKGYGMSPQLNKWDFVQTQAQSPVPKIRVHEVYEPPSPQISKQKQQYRGVAQVQNKQQPKQPKQQKQSKQSKQMGRKLQYPHYNYKNIGHQHQHTHKNDHKNNRPHSASFTNNNRSQSQKTLTNNNSSTYVDRTVKSRSIIEERQIKDQKIRVAMNYLLENNSDYLNQKLSLCHLKAKPKQQLFKINLAKTLSTYIDHYPPKSLKQAAKFHLQIKPRNKQQAFSIGDNPVCGNSTTHEFHNGVQGPKADLATWQPGYKLEGPMDGTTAYMNHFPNWGTHEKMVPVATFNQHPSGLQFKPNTTHRDHYTGKYTERPKSASWNNLHPYGNDFNPDRGTQTGDTHGVRSSADPKNKDKLLKDQKWPNYDPRLLVSKGKYDTEYGTEMINYHKHDLHDGNRCKCSKCSRKRPKRLGN